MQYFTGETNQPVGLGPKITQSHFYFSTSLSRSPSQLLPSGTTQLNAIDKVCCAINGILSRAKEA